MNTQINYTPGSEIGVQHGGRTLWRYHFATDHRKPFFHPVSTTTGAELTCFEPWDHWWHRGLWFSWQYINGVNYWEEDIEELGPKGSLEFIGPEELDAGPDQIVIRTHYHYHPTPKNVVLHDTRIIAIAMPDREGCYTMDWDLAFTPTVDVAIDRVHEDWGGYSGLSWRTSRAMGGFALVNSDGKTGDDTQHQQARWVDLTGKADGGRDLSGGMTFMVHPDTPRNPAHWKTFANPGFGYINPSPVMVEPLRLKAGDVCRMKYRVLVHPGTMQPESLEEAYQRYCKQD